MRYNIEYTPHLNSKVVMTTKASTYINLSMLTSISEVVLKMIAVAGQRRQYPPLLRRTAVAVVLTLV